MHVLWFPNFHHLLSKGDSLLEILLSHKNLINIKMILIGGAKKFVSQSEKKLRSTKKNYFIALWWRLDTLVVNDDILWKQKKCSQLKHSFMQTVLSESQSTSMRFIPNWNIYNQPPPLGGANITATTINQNTNDEAILEPKKLDHSRDGCTLALVQARAPTLFLIFSVSFLFIVLHSNNYICSINYQ